MTSTKSSHVDGQQGPEWQIHPLAPQDALAAAALWEACGLTVPWNDPEADFLRACDGPSSQVLGIRDEGGDKLVATVMVGHEGHRGWMYYVAVDPALQGRGIGRQLVAAAEKWLAQCGVPKAMLMVRATNAAAQGFYESLGYETSTVVVMQRWI
ncbi:GNAT family acetyltransferase [Schaalia sp. 19OD2882]|uniref:GNAT family acetyltransferase n=1 Tax=Schaalia sp. 19OD2882 TaxID=2794089 RepID=UPI001C1EAE5D|nr:GNAT family acetyltransferase [Schaalia sp. 19OD2882]QWW19419.1 GNAT family acetyltransferase [Schaalia sp. 19OD2882]